jgi:hypothetical protein
MSSHVYTGVVVQRKFTPVLARQVTVRCICEPAFSQRRCLERSTSRASGHNENSRRLEYRRCRDRPKRIGYTARLKSTIGNCFHLGIELARRIATSPNNLQPRLRRRIQQINSLLEPFILHECRICFLSCLHRCMPQQMLHIRNYGTPTQ